MAVLGMWHLKVNSFHTRALAAPTEPVPLDLPLEAHAARVKGAVARAVANQHEVLVVAAAADDARRRRRVEAAREVGEPRPPRLRAPRGLRAGVLEAAAAQRRVARTWRGGRRRAPLARDA